MLSGSAGGIVALANIAPKACTRLFELWKEGDVAGAKKIQDIFVHADWTVGKIGGIGGVKAVVTQAFGYGSPAVRGPLLAASAEKLQSPGMKHLEQLLELEKTLPDFAAKTS